MPIPQIEDLKARVVAYCPPRRGHHRQVPGIPHQADPGTLNEVVEKEEPRANEFEVELEEECTSLIAQHQPMAKELRTILMVSSMTNDLERMADHAVNIAEAALSASGFPPRPDEDLLKLFEETIRMVDNAVRSFIEANAELGSRSAKRTRGVDQLATDILERISASMTKDPFTIEQSLCILKIAGNLERIADLSTNIGEDVIYMTEGRVIKHHHGGGAIVPVPQRIASIDMGTNAIRFFAVEMEGDSLSRVLAEERFAVRFGHGVFSAGRISPEASAGALEGLERISAQMKDLGIERYRAVATSAVRESPNRREFVRASSSARVSPWRSSRGRRRCALSTLPCAGASS